MPLLHLIPTARPAQGKAPFEGTTPVPAGTIGHNLAYHQDPDSQRPKLPKSPANAKGAVKNDSSRRRQPGALGPAAQIFSPDPR